jgi:hypothetical protein
LGEKVLDCPINWKLAIDRFAENYHFATVHKTTFATIARSNCTVFDSPQRNSRSREHSGGAVGSAAQHSGHLCAVPEHRVVVYPTDVPGRSITVHQNSTPLDLSDESAAAGAAAVFDYAHATVRDDDYALVAGLQANLASGAREHLVCGRNEPGLQHRHQTWQEAISRRT